MKKSWFSLLILLTILPATISAKVKLPEVIGDNMVLQQDTQVRLWGMATKNSNVKISLSWNSQPFFAKADNAGDWEIMVPTPKASFIPQKITFEEGEKLLVNNILIGEVWFCSGQSNMEMPLNGFWNCPVMDANETISKANTYKGFRFVNISKKGALMPQNTCKGTWMTSTPENLQWCSAVGFHFADMIKEILDVPVGIINCSWGGSSVEGWLPAEILKQYPDIDLKQAGNEKVEEYRQPMIMYNGMLKPMEKYTIKGFLWYQGESNVGKHLTYPDRLSTLVTLWRKEWGLGNLPFYFVEIAPYNYGDEVSGAYLREAQFKAQSLIPNSALVSTNDLVEAYESGNIHPKDKTDVGKRLAYLALTNTYGIKGVSDRGPSFRSMEILENKAIIHFNGAEDGFNRIGDIVGFEMAGADKMFYPAHAKVLLNDKTVEVTCDKVAIPVAVRYAFKNFYPGNLGNTRNLPVFPFRTDNW